MSKECEKRIHAHTCKMSKWACDEVRKKPSESVAVSERRQTVSVPCTSFIQKEEETKCRMRHK